MESPVLRQALGMQVGACLRDAVNMHPAGLGWAGRLEGGAPAAGWIGRRVAHPPASAPGPRLRLRPPAARAARRASSPRGADVSNQRGAQQRRHHPQVRLHGAGQRGRGVQWRYEMGPEAAQGAERTQAREPPSRRSGAWRTPCGSSRSSPPLEGCLHPAAALMGWTLVPTARCPSAQASASRSPTSSAKKWVGCGSGFRGWVGWWAGFPPAASGHARGCPAPTALAAPSPLRSTLLRSTLCAQPSALNPAAVHWR